MDKYYKDLANIKTIMMGSKDTLEVSEKSSDIKKWNYLWEEKGGLQGLFWKGEFVWQSGAS